MIQRNKEKLLRHALVVLTLGFATGLTQFASAATLCVNPGGTGGCKSTINAAVGVAAAGDIINVEPGTYTEDVIISKSLSLIGSGRPTTIIDATGKSNGIFIDGTASAPKPGVSNVVVTGFTIQHANFEGILVASASAITIVNVNVVNNNLSLQPGGGCPGLPDFETNEGDDCGEGIHLMGVDHSIVANSTSRANSGGILISDETGPTHDNLITANIAYANSFDCGITLPSHPPAPSTGAMVSFGVYHNTVSNNLSSFNGLATPGAGAGIGIFAPGPGASAYGNVIVGNTIVGNGLPGVTMHNHAAPGVDGVPAHVPAVNFNDNLITENYISGNLADTNDAATPGTTGINVFSVAPMTGTMISKNTILDEAYDVVVNIPPPMSGPSPIDVHLNSFIPPAVAIDALTAVSVEATQNWFGCAAGPGNAACSSVSGSVISAPWLSSALPVGTPTGPGSPE